MLPRVFIRPQFSHSGSRSIIFRVCQVEAADAPYIRCGKPGNIGKVFPQVCGKAFNNCIAPALGLLLSHNVAANAKIKRNQFPADG